MKKLLSVSPSKILILCGIGLLTTLGAFWHLQTNQHQLDRMNVLGQGVNICFNRISQSFTALMIKDVNSAYLNRGFMGLSDECLNETIKGINPFKQNVGKGYETLNKLISEVHWFHETVNRAHGPMMAGKKETSLNPVSEKYYQMEDLKASLIDEMDVTMARLRDVQASDEVLMGTGLLIFVLSLSLLALQEFNRIQLRREIEAHALSLLRAGQSNTGAMVDRLVDRGLTSQGLLVTAQIFRDYHGELLELISHRTTPEKKEEAANTSAAAPTPEAVVSEKPEMPAAYSGPKSSLKEAMVSILNIHSKELINANEVRDVQLMMENEVLEQIISSAVNKLIDRRTDKKKVMISNQVHADRTLLNFYLAGSTFTAGELEFSQSENAAFADGIDMNMVLMKELMAETNCQWHVENKTDRDGNITGMGIRFTIGRVPKEPKSKNLVSVFKGKKKDLTREMMN